MTMVYCQLVGFYMLSICHFMMLYTCEIKLYLRTGLDSSYGLEYNDKPAINGKDSL